MNTFVKIRPCVLVGFVLFILSGISNPTHAAPKTSVKSGNWNDATVWDAGIPGTSDDVIITAGDTVTLVANVTLRSLTIQANAVLEAGTYDYICNYHGDQNWIFYTNNGIHNATTGAVYTNGGMGVDGSGVSNCNFEMKLDGFYFVNTCNLTINGDVYTVDAFSYGRVYNYGTLTINGDITLSTSSSNIFNYSIFNQTGSLSTGNSSYLENNGTFNISGNLTMGNGESLFWNVGTTDIGGDVLGSGLAQSYFMQEANSTARFGGSVFPTGNEGNLCAAGTSASGNSSEPNTIEYYGTNQVIETPGDYYDGASSWWLAGTYSNLTISNTPGNASLNSDITVNDTLSFTSGKLILETYNLTLATPTAITGYSSSNYIVTNNTGYLQINGVTTPAMSFPIGISTSSYTPATINNNGGGATATNFSVMVADKVYSAQGNVQVADMVDRTWHITGSGGNADATLTLQWNATEELVPFDRANCGISHFNSPTWDVPAYSAASGSGPYTQTRSGINTFSPFAIEAASHPLPIELLNFTGKLNADGQVVLNWSTATETNNDYFTIECAASPPLGGDTEGVTFVPLGTVKGAGNSSIPLNYHFPDKSPSPLERVGVRYYRLKQTDYDGKFSYSQIVSISLQYPGSIIVYPSPAIDNVNLYIPGEQEEPLLLSVIDELGRTLIEKKENLKEGQNAFNIDVSALSTGVYSLQLLTASGIRQQRQLMIGK